MRHYCLQLLAIKMMKSTTLLLSVTNAVQAQFSSYSCPSSCVLPSCRCATRDRPVANPPQFLVVTYDDGLNAANLIPARAVFAQRKNPNGCPAGATFFAQATYTDPYLLTQWYASGSEVADHSFTHGVPLPPGQNSPFTGSYNEIIGTKKWFNAYAGIPNGKVSGVRFPYRNYTVKGLQDLKAWGFQYDSSMAAQGDERVWPYTLDHGVVTDCAGASSLCLNQDARIPGLWELPLSATSGSEGAHLMDPYNDYDVANPINPITISATLETNFQSLYAGNRAPFGVYLHPVWLTSNTPGIPDGSMKLAALQKFLDGAMANPDVWMVTSAQVIEYMKNPVDASQVGNQSYMQCNFQPTPNICNGGPSSQAPQSCNFPSGTFRTCFNCPAQEPTVETAIQDAPKGSRCPVPDSCDMIFWDPVGCKCTCEEMTRNQDFCSKYKDTAPPAYQGPNINNPFGGGGGGNGNSAAHSPASLLTRGLPTIVIFLLVFMI